MDTTHTGACTHSRTPTCTQRTVRYRYTYTYTVHVHSEHKMLYNYRVHTTHVRYDPMPCAQKKPTASRVKVMDETVEFHLTPN